MPPVPMIDNNSCLGKLISARDLDSKISLKIVFIIYISISLVGVFSHALWRDEMQVG